MKRKQHQKGTVTLQSRIGVPDVWVFRYSEGGKRRAQILGDIKALPTKSLAEVEADKYRPTIAHSSHSMNIGEAVEKYLKEATHVRPHEVANKKSLLYSFRSRWGAETASYIQRHLIEVELWLNTLEKRKGGLYSQKSKRLIKGEMHCLFESIMRRGGMDIQRNPISLIRIKGDPRKTRQQTILTVEQYHALRELTEPHVSMMIMLAMCLGLRISEVLGLRWEHIDLVNGSLVVSASSVGKHQAQTKTVASNDDLPLHDEVVRELKIWKEASAPMNGWVFESPTTGRPYHRESLQQKHLIPAGRALAKKLGKGIQSLGWHSFRHTYRHLMAEMDDIPLEVQQRLMRHADIRTTTGYGGRKNKNLRKHNASVIEMIGRKEA
jgi:integrase